MPSESQDLGWGVKGRVEAEGKHPNPTNRYCIHTSFRDSFFHSCFHPLSPTRTSVPVAPALPQDLHPRTLCSSAIITPASRNSIQPLEHQSSCFPYVYASPDIYFKEHLLSTTSKREQCYSRHSSAPTAWSAGT